MLRKHGRLYYLMALAFDAPFTAAAWMICYLIGFQLGLFSYVKPIPPADWVVATDVCLLPGRLLAAGEPLSRCPPSADLLGTRRVFQIQNNNYIAQITVHFG